MAFVSPLNAVARPANKLAPVKLLKVFIEEASAL